MTASKEDRDDSLIEATDSPSLYAHTASPTHQGKLIIDATVAEQAIRYPTDLGLLNEARELTEQIIDKLYAASVWVKKPRTYRQKARKAYLGLVKQKRLSGKVLRRGLKQQLQYVKRNLGHIERLMDEYSIGQPFPLSRWLLHRYWVLQHVYTQQLQMYAAKNHRCDDRIVSIGQPYVRPIVRGKQNKPVEFGSKMSVSLLPNGLSRVDHISFDAFNEGNDLPGQVVRFKERYGCYPERVVGDPIYGSRANRAYLKERGIVFSGKPLGRPKKETPQNQAELKAQRAKRRADYRQRIPIEGKFGQGKNGYRLNYIRAKRSDTSMAWINSIFLVMNLIVLRKVLFCARILRVREWIISFNWSYRSRVDRKPFYLAGWARCCLA